jgi:hypothetical protein
VSALALAQQGAHAGRHGKPDPQAAAVLPPALSNRKGKVMQQTSRTIRDGKIAKTYHLENWLSALGQLRGKQ